VGGIDSGASLGDGGTVQASTRRGGSEGLTTTQDGHYGFVFCPSTPLSGVTEMRAHLNQSGEAGRAARLLALPDQRGTAFEKTPPRLDDVRPVTAMSANTISNSR
jgi:hypothetical protein